MCPKVQDSSSWIWFQGLKVLPSFSKVYSKEQKWSQNKTHSLHILLLGIYNPQYHFKKSEKSYKKKPVYPSISDLIQPWKFLKSI